MAENLFEKVKTFLTTGTNKEYSSEVLPTQVTVHGGEEEYYPFAVGFMDNGNGGGAKPKSLFHHLFHL